MFGQALCDILPARKRLGRPQQQFLCRYTIYIKAGSVQFRQRYDAAYYPRDWNVLIVHSNNNFCFGSISIKVDVDFSCLWAGIIKTKRFRVVQLKDVRVLAITFLKSTT
mmetsp:Transcript_42160/g.47973  ORF Transcript_42160/g.47973 Transcript_42160/m.47973 type:complete len:109 (-) Transcript_42160:32-358(-)